MAPPTLTMIGERQARPQICVRPQCDKELRALTVAGSAVDPLIIMRSMFLLRNSANSIAPSAPGVITSGPAGVDGTVNSVIAVRVEFSEPKCPVRTHSG